MFSRKTRQIDTGKEATVARQATDTPESCTVGKQCIGQTEKATERQCVKMNSNVLLFFFSSWTRSGTPIYIFCLETSLHNSYSKRQLYIEKYFFLKYFMGTTDTTSRLNLEGQVCMSTPYVYIRIEFSESAAQ